MKRFDENYIRSSISHWPPYKIGNVLNDYNYSEDLLREIWNYIDLNSCFWMKKYKFSFDFLREMKMRIMDYFWYYIIVCNEVYTHKEKERMVKEFDLKYIKYSEKSWVAVLK